jgi:hypothetical protein
VDAHDEEAVMAGKLDAYGLGERGVEIVDSPVHLQEGALLSAQNACLDRVESEGGIAKRKGWAKYNAIASGATILAIENVPWTDPSP